MRNFFGRLGYRMQTWMQGRYGNDQLNRLLTTTALVFIVASLFRGLVSWLGYFSWAAMVLLLFSIFRSMSRNMQARQRENERYLKIKNKIISFFKLQKRKWNDRSMYRYYTCPKCHATVRVPVGKGRIQITCRKCGNQFIKRT